jgi:hypothetical protein
MKIMIHNKMLANVYKGQEQEGRQRSQINSMGVLQNAGYA